MTEPFAFHAAAPDGEWLNDPNALLYADGAYRLFAQHRADPPVFAATGWARFSSDDLLAWRFEAAVLPPDGDDWAYSGSVIRAGSRLEAFHTSHSRAGEKQLRRVSENAGSTWDAEAAAVVLGPPQPNFRDPYVFAYESEWRMLVSRPCDWTDWAATPPSTLELYRSCDRLIWERCGTVGPWAPNGVLWEVPLVLQLNGRWVLIVSTVDRRDGRALCGVRYWIGGFDGTAFHPLPDWPGEGRPLDLGPDFYAAMVNVEDNWPSADRVLIGWLSSWNTARRFPWPHGAGGPISLPRRLNLVTTTAGPRIAQLPEVSASAFHPCQNIPLSGCAMATIAGDAAFELRVEGERALLQISGDPAAGTVAIKRRADQSDLDWEALHSGLLQEPCATRTLTLFIDGPTIELFIAPDGLTASAAIPTGGRTLRVALDGAPLAWTRFISSSECDELIPWKMCESAQVMSVQR